MFAFKRPRIPDLPAREGVGAELQEKIFNFITILKMGKNN